MVVPIVDSIQTLNITPSPFLIRFCRLADLGWMSLVCAWEITCPSIRVRVGSPSASWTFEKCKLSANDA